MSKIEKLPDGRHKLTISGSGFEMSVIFSEDRLRALWMLIEDHLENKQEIPSGFEKSIEVVQRIMDTGMFCFRQASSPLIHLSFSDGNCYCDENISVPFVVPTAVAIVNSSKLCKNCLKRFNENFRSKPE